MPFDRCGRVVIVNIPNQLQYQKAENFVRCLVDLTHREGRNHFAIRHNLRTINHFKNVNLNCYKSIFFFLCPPCWFLTTADQFGRLLSRCDGTKRGGEVRGNISNVHISFINH